MIDLDALIDPKWTRDYAVAINDAGQITAYGSSQNSDHQESLLLTPIR
jgi:hypothetical protein